MELSTEFQSIRQSVGTIMGGNKDRETSEEKRMRA